MRAEKKADKEGFSRFERNREIEWISKLDEWKTNDANAQKENEIKENEFFFRFAAEQNLIYKRCICIGPVGNNNNNQAEIIIFPILTYVIRAAHSQRIQQKQWKRAPSEHIFSSTLWPCAFS